MTTNTQGYAETPWYRTETHNGRPALRNKGGLVVSFYKPSKYQGQEDRYEREIAEMEATIALVRSAPEMAERIATLQRAAGDAEVRAQLAERRAVEAEEAVNQERLAKAIVVAKGEKSPYELVARTEINDPIDGHFWNGNPGQFVWRTAMDMAGRAMEALRAHAGEVKP